MKDYIFQHQNTGFEIIFYRFCKCDVGSPVNGHFIKLPIGKGVSMQKITKKLCDFNGKQLEATL